MIKLAILLLFLNLVGDVSDADVIAFVESGYVAAEEAKANANSEIKTIELELKLAKNPTINPQAARVAIGKNNKDQETLVAPSRNALGAFVKEKKSKLSGLEKALKDAPEFIPPTSSLLIIDRAAPNTFGIPHVSAVEGDGGLRRDDPTMLAPFRLPRIREGREPGTYLASTNKREVTIRSAEPVPLELKIETVCRLIKANAREIELQLYSPSEIVELQKRAKELIDSKKKTK